MTVTIFHNPACGTSRNVLAMIRQSGVEPDIVEYLKEPPTRQQLVALLVAMDMSPRDLIRTKGRLYEELGLSDESLSDRALLDAMLEHPILIERPIVMTERGIRLCRPSERVLEILPDPVTGGFVNEDDEVLEAPDQTG